MLSPTPIVSNSNTAMYPHQPIYTLSYNTQNANNQQSIINNIPPPKVNNSSNRTNWDNPQPVISESAFNKLNQATTSSNSRT